MRYLREYRRITYTNLLANDKLNTYLTEYAMKIVK